MKNGTGYKAIFDVIPELTYEEVGMNYVGSATNENGEIIASRLLKYESFGNAFAGRELELKMKDGSVKIIKNHWYDYGSYKEHGEFISIGAGTLEELQKCYVYFSYNINKETFEKMIEEYLSRDKLYDYWDVEKWCKLQYEWYDVVVHGKKIPFMMNKYGDMVDKWTKESVYARHNAISTVNGKWKSYTYFKFNYKENGNTIKIEANYSEVLNATLPYSDEEIRVNCKLPPEQKRESMPLTANELLDRLSGSEGKDKKIKLSLDGKVIDKFYISESSGTILLSGVSNSK